MICDIESNRNWSWDFASTMTSLRCRPFLSNMLVVCQKSLMSADTNWCLHFIFLWFGGKIGAAQKAAGLQTIMGKLSLCCRLNNVYFLHYWLSLEINRNNVYGGLLHRSTLVYRVLIERAAFFPITRVQLSALSPCFTFPHHSPFIPIHSSQNVKSEQIYGSDVASHNSQQPWAEFTELQLMDQLQRRRHLSWSHGSTEYINWHNIKLKMS